MFTCVYTLGMIGADHALRYTIVLMCTGKAVLFSEWIKKKIISIFQQGSKLKVCCKYTPNNIFPRGIITCKFETMDYSVQSLTECKNIYI